MTCRKCPDPPLLVLMGVALCARHYKIWCKDILTNPTRLLATVDNYIERRLRGEAIIRMRENDRLSYREIGEKLGVSPKRAWDLYMDAIEYKGVKKNESPKPHSGSQ